jgi:hypothetical protein
MALTINDDSMTSDRTGHTARPVPGHRHAWVVSWLPGHHLDRNSAITAMVIADASGTAAWIAATGCGRTSKAGQPNSA